LWWVDLDWTPGAHGATPSLLLLKKDRVRKYDNEFMGRDKDGEITYESLSRAK